MAAQLAGRLLLASSAGCTHCERSGRKLPIADVCEECRFDDRQLEPKT